MNNIYVTKDMGKILYVATYMTQCNFIIIIALDITELI